MCLDNSDKSILGQFNDVLVDGGLNIGQNPRILTRRRLDSADPRLTLRL